MRNTFYVLLILVLGSILLYYACNSERENLKISLAFQYNEEGIGNFIEKYANKIVVSVYGNNFVPIKKGIEFPSNPEWICVHDGGYYEPDAENNSYDDIMIPPTCNYEDRQFAKIVVPISVPVGTDRSIIVETLDKNGNITFRGSKNSLNITEDTSVNIELNPISVLNIAVNEMTDIPSSKFESANVGTLKAYYFERGKKVGNELVNQATLLGEQDVRRDQKIRLEFAYSGQYSIYNSQEQKSYFYPSLFAYYKGENNTISYMVPGLAESFGYGLEPGGSYDLVIYSALRDKIKQDPLLTAVTPSQINYNKDKGSWDWMYVYLSYIHALGAENVKVMRVKIKTDFSEEIQVISTVPREGEESFNVEVYDVGRLKGIEDEFYMGFRCINILNYNVESIPKTSGDITFWMEFETLSGKNYKTNEVKIKYNINNNIPSDDAGLDSGL